MYNHLKHDTPNCAFINRPYLFNKANLLNLDFLKSIPQCSCFEFAYVFISPEYANVELTLDEYLEFASRSEAWEFVTQTNYKYNLNSSRTKECRDPFVKNAMKEFDPSLYYECCDKNKTPRVGRMYASLIQYLFPLARKPRIKDRYFYQCMEKAITQVFQNFDECKPIHYTEAMNVMPKNTSAGFNGLQYTGTTERKRKDEILPYIAKRYLENQERIRLDLEVEDYCIFAMRGHLSDRLKSKTRPIWLVSASTIVAELKYYTPFYRQIEEKNFFRDMWITGKQSIPRLNRYLRRHPEMWFYNTDISGWDSYRAAWFHERIMRELKSKMILSPLEIKEFEYLIDSAIRTKVLFPNGQVWQKKAGIISGTAGTLLFNSLLNTIAGLTITLMMKVFSFWIEDDFCNKMLQPNWLGDDFAFIWMMEQRFDLEKFSKLMLQYFNVVIKPEKTVETRQVEERKFLGYQLRGGFLYRDTKEFFQSVLYCERPFPKTDSLAISFSRFFSYLLLGGVNDYHFVSFFYYYMGKYKEKLLLLTSVFERGMDNIFKLLKDVWNITIPNFNIHTFRNINLTLMKYALLYGYDLKFSDLLF